MRLRQSMKKKRSKSIDLTNALKFYWTTDIHMKESVDRQPNAAGAIVLSNRYRYASMTKLKQMIDQANANPLKAFIISGDVFDDSQDFSFFMPEWNRIDASMRKELTIGNHDLVGSADGNVCYNNLVTGFGYNGRTVNAGSVFNQSFSLTNGTVSARVIMLDSNFDNSGNHVSTEIGYYPQAVLDWLQSELTNCSESIVLLFTHMLPHNYNVGYFDQTSAFAIRDIVNTLKVSQPSKVIHCLGGHNHQTSLLPYSNLGNNFKGYLGEALCLYDKADYMVVNVMPNKDLYFEYKNVQYV